MEKLLQPDTGLIIWTTITFLILVVILSKTAWKPILAGIEEREKHIRENIERAEKANADATALRQQYETQIASSQRQMQDLIGQARSEGEKARAELVAAARAESDRIIEKGRRDLAGETDKLREVLRSEVASLSMDVAEKIIGRSIDQKVADEILKESLKSVSEVKI